MSASKEHEVSEAVSRALELDRLAQILAEDAAVRLDPSLGAADFARRAVMFAKLAMANVSAKARADVLQSEANSATGPSPAADFAQRLMSKSEACRVVEAGEAWLHDNRPTVSALSHGTVIALNVANGKFVTGRNGLEAMDKFEAEFGTEARAWVHEVGVPITLGGGIWALSSEA